MLLQLGLAVRAVLLLVGAWQDAHGQVKFTDIDYEVVTDGAARMAQGGSPFERSTYRYTPLLAAALVPNVTLHKAFGKLLFCAADLLAAWMFRLLLRRRGACPRLQAAGVALWLFSPFTVTISTRGNGEALVACMLLAMLLALDSGHLVPAAALFGLAVHWRLYPIVFSLPLLRHFALLRQQSLKRQQQAGPPQQPRALLAAAVGGLVSPAGLAFGAVSGAVFLALGTACYRLYGWPFLHETYLYHARRTDPRHNFSPYFYPAYLSSSTAPGSDSWDVGWAFSAAQAVLQMAIGPSCASDLPFCFMLQTAVLVAFNKVSTAQYFVWHLSFLPLVLPDLAAAPNRGRLMAAAAGWGAAMAHWLLWAYLLEFAGWQVHLAVWGASLAFFATHVWLVCELVVAWRHKRDAALAVKQKSS
ncbi:GPI mannosyltransferase 1 [Chlorella vulgaris]